MVFRPNLGDDSIFFFAWVHLAEVYSPIAPITWSVFFFFFDKFLNVVLTFEFGKRKKGGGMGI